ncbi:bestrophin family protein [Flavihumibacter sp. UBA7668]|uniref:bestrophin family protein n=1 Tax=Flavihumibacter sp. UBA7668 TaxID=1946542 RepID=UPI0025C07EB8|nr:bestrophin family ion channel [Flavihumibacter sp. UBA7668]
MLLRKNIPFSYVLGKIKTELLLITIYAIVIAVLYENYHITRISIPIAVPTILGTIISLLLGFRSNQAYDRWWEARHIWGAIVNDSRSLSRQVISFTSNLYEDENIQRFRQRLINRQIAWNYALGQSLRKKSALKGLDKWISKKDYEYAEGFDNVPAALLDLHSRDIKVSLDKGWINTYQHVELDRTISRLCDCMGKCERIKNTVFPVTYSLYIHFSLLLFIALLPFGVIQYFGMFEVPLVVAISASFLLIEKMAIHLQDPFENKPTDTPMTSIAAGIEKNLKQMLAEEVPEQELVPEQKYFMM